MPASRIPFALSDAVKEVKSLLREDEEPTIELHLDVPTYVRVKAELEHHYGASLQKSTARDLRMRGAEAVKFAGMTIIAIPPGR